MIRSEPPAYTWLIACAAFVLGCPPDIDWGVGHSGPQPGLGGSAGSAGNGGNAGTGAGGAGGGGVGGSAVGGAGAAPAAGSGGKAGTGGTESDVPDGGVRDGGPDAGGLGGSGGDSGAAPKCAPNEPSCVQIEPALAAAPCAGIPYSHVVSAVGGEGPFTWEIEPASGNFALQFEEGDGERETVRIVSTGSAGPSQGGLVKLRLRDNGSPQLSDEIDLDLSLRSSCWFAYLSDEAPAPGFHLRDVFLVNDYQPSTGVDGAASDFKFSPDGRWIAFRVETAAGPRLFTYDARARGNAATPTGLECPTDGVPAAAGCGVIDYAWSADSNHLAVVLGGVGTTQDYLGGISGFSSETGPGTASPLVREVYWFAGTPPVEESVPLDYFEQLVWADSRFVGFWGEPRGNVIPTRPYGFLSANPDGAPLIDLLDPYSDLQGDSNAPAPLGSRLIAVEGGLVIAFPADPNNGSATLRHYTEYPFGGQPSHSDAWLSPSRRWAARLTENQALSIHPLADRIQPRASSAAGACLGVVAWSLPVAGGLELLACRAPAGSTSFFSFDEVGSSLTPLKTIPVEVGLGIRRAFSPDGRWFVFGVPSGGEAAQFLAVDLTESQPDVVSLAYAKLPAELEFPGNRDVVVVSDDQLLREYNLVSASGIARDNFILDNAVRSACQEASVLGAWCGAPVVAANLRYSDDFRTLLFERSARALNISQSGIDPDAELVTDRLPLCGGRCLSPAYGFQP